MTNNSQKYLDTYLKFEIGNQELLDILGPELHTSPASPRTNQYNSFENGLIGHLLNIANYSVKLNSILPIGNQYPVGTVLRVALLSEIGKVGMFKETNDAWKKKIGNNYDYTDGRESLRTGQRSIYFINQAGIKLSEVEYAAILNSDSLPDDQMVNYHNSRLGDNLKHAITLAIHDEKTT